ncbi:MAG: non-homologous end-joining DNA ligase [Chitinophagaceae bacterium]
MSLEEYKKKRKFDNTPEPKAELGKKGTELIFVVQKHNASHLHYDFRLELGGVLKSWAVPKGPSMNPEDKRLAMHVEDHPFDYKDFEGIIPKGNYGAGTVILWDQGTYTPAEATTNYAAMEKLLAKEMDSGSMRIVLKGKKLNGEFALVKSKNRDDNSWLLIKKTDKYSGKVDVTLKDKSVVSKKTIEQVAVDQKAKKWISNRSRKELKEEVEEEIPEKTGAQKKLSSSSLTAAIKKALAAHKGLVKTPMPKDLRPMLATLVDKPFDDPEWIYEVKWDGYRAVGYVNTKVAELRSRNNNSFNEKFYPVVKALQDWPVKAVVDGEIVVLNEKGITKFSDLQNWRSEADGDLVYYLFDILWLDGKDLTRLTVIQRREILRAIIPGEGIIRISENFETSATEFLAVAQQMGLEGIIAKKADSLYSPNLRTREWLKIKTGQRHEALITGYTRNEETSKNFSSLLLGVNEGRELKFIGQVGTGFTEKLRIDLLAKMNALQTGVCPFPVVPSVNKPSRFRPNPPKARITWLKPELICEVRYQELTAEGVMRHASFQGLREDKAAKEVVMDVAGDTEKVVNKKQDLPATTENAVDSKKGKAMAERTEKNVDSKKGKAMAERTENNVDSKKDKAVAEGKAKAVDSKKRKAVAEGTEKNVDSKKDKAVAEGTTKAVDRKQIKAVEKVIKPVTKGDRKSLLNPKDESQTRKIDGHDLKFTNLSKIYWPDEQITKRDMLNYYYQVAPYMLPYMLDRPQSLNRHPNGINGESFYQKNVSGKVEPWIITHDYENTTKDGGKTFLVCTNEASLMYIAKLGCIEMNPWHSRISSPDHPDWCVVDLDPDTNTFDEVIEVARVVHKILDAVAIPSFPKTSGSTGIHIYIPLGAAYDYEQSKQLAELVVTIAHQELGSFTSLERSPQKRKGKIYLDFLQNRAIQTIAAPYSLRPKPGATASAPLHWDEIKKGLKMGDFNINTMMTRIKSEGDLFKGVLGKGIDLHAALERFTTVFG